MSLHVELARQMRLLFFASASIGLCYSSTISFHGSNDLLAVVRVQWHFISDRCLPSNICFIYIGCISLCGLEI